MKKNIALAIVSALLLGSLTLHGFVFRSWVLYQQDESYFEQMCPIQMALVDSLKSECIKLFPNKETKDVKQSDPSQQK